MEPGHKTAAARVFRDVFESFAFLFGDAVAAGDLPALEGAGYLARLPFRGGCLALAVSEGLAVEIASGTLGIEPGDPEAARLAPDAVKEVASVMGGHWVSAVAASGPLSPPEIRPLGAAEWELLRADPGTQCFSVNDRPAMLRVELA